MIKWLVSDFSQVLLFPKDHGYKGSLNELYALLQRQPNFSFFDVYWLNLDLLDFYTQMRDQHHLSLAIFTTGTVQDHPELQPFLLPIFSKIMTIRDVGCAKTDSAAYTKIAETLGIHTNEMVFLDDTRVNVTAAQEAGVHAFRYSSNAQAIQEITQFLHTHTD